MHKKISIFERKVETIDGRQNEKDPILYYEPTAKISSLYAKELYEAMEKKLENVLVFEVRNCMKIRKMRKDLKKYFIEFESDEFELYYADYKKGNEAFFILKANKIT